MVTIGDNKDCSRVLLYSPSIPLLQGGGFFEVIGFEGVCLGVHRAFEVQTNRWPT